MLFIFRFPYVVVFSEVPETCFLDPNHFLSQSQQRMEAGRGRASGVSAPSRIRECLSLSQIRNKSSLSGSSGASRKQGWSSGDEAFIWNDGHHPRGARLMPPRGCHPDCLYSEAAGSRLRLSWRKSQCELNWDACWCCDVIYSVCDLHRIFCYFSLLTNDNDWGFFFLGIESLCFRVFRPSVPFL